MRKLEDGGEVSRLCDCGSQWGHRTVGIGVPGELADRWRRRSERESWRGCRYW